VKDLVGVCGFLIIYLGIIFFAPDLGGIFLEKDNFAPANSLQTPPDIVPLWYFTPYYSILRASTEQLLQVFAIGTGVIGVAAILFTKFKAPVKIGIAIASVAFVFIFLNSSGKAWGVILMGASLVMFFLLPWLDRSPVKSIRYRSMPFKIALVLFLIAFIILGYLGMNSPTPGRTLMAQICTVVYFAFFLLMPWFTSIGKTKPVPDRVTYDAH
ncbi:MAG: cytochrome bc complex cytochrome b subunit, partial [Gammaproteobacteria bacterium]|nr:cytochrome bc complex cytochrome b subunit [Gammaproteobacteria bacterium]